VRIINNSWGTDIFPDQSKDFDTDEKYSTFYYPINEISAWIHGEKEAELINVALELAYADKLLAYADKLVVFAAGNDGHLSPSGEAALPTFVEKFGTKNLSVNI
jgi:subtilase-type serine protease